jgi:hypothetical protein
MKDGLCWKHANDDAVIVAVKKWLSEADSNFYKRRMQPLVQRWRKCVQGGGEYVEK